MKKYFYMSHMKSPPRPSPYKGLHCPHDHMTMHTIFGAVTASNEQISVWTGFGLDLFHLLSILLPWIVGCWALERCLQQPPFGLRYLKNWHISHLLAQNSNTSIHFLLKYVYVFLWMWRKNNVPNKIQNCWTNVIKHSAFKHSTK